MSVDAMSQQEIDEIMNLVNQNPENDEGFDKLIKRGQSNRLNKCDPEVKLERARWFKLYLYQKIKKDFERFRSEFEPSPKILNLVGKSYTRVSKHVYKPTEKIDDLKELLDCF